MKHKTKWYAHFSKILGIHYNPLAPVDPEKLWNRGARPQVEHYSFDGKQHDSIMWLTADGGYTSASPAQQHSLMLSNPTPTEILTHLSEALELPGTASDYHFALQGAHESLWRHRRAQADLYNTIETICHLDIALVTLLGQDMYGDSPFAVLAFNCLAGIYEVEGRLNEALAVYKQAESQGHFVRSNRGDQLRAVLGAGS